MAQPVFPVAPLGFTLGELRVLGLRVVDQLLHGKEEHVFVDSGYRGIVKWSRRKRIRWAVVMTSKRFGVACAHSLSQFFRPS